MACITNEQKREIVKLSEEHRDALIAFGGDLYRRGLMTGYAATMLSVAISCVSLYLYEEHLKKKLSKKGKVEETC